VLARDSDVSALVNAGLAAGAVRGYLPESDQRIIAATRIVGGGESTTVKFSTAGLVQGTRYAFFCTAPGHSAMMHGKFEFGPSARLPGNTDVGVPCGFRGSRKKKLRASPQAAGRAQCTRSQKCLHHKHLS
jgi:hypothetical protein